MFSRQQYLNRLVQAQGNGMIKIITGIRRCGKSYLLFTIFRNYLLSHGTNEAHIIMVDLESRRNAKLRNPDALLEYIDSQMKDSEHYFVLLDEVQLVPEFEDVLNSYLKMPNVDVYVTGSNAKFLSSDVITEFRGRGWEIRIHPLSFAEFYEYQGGNKQDAFTTYCRFGGLPQVVLMKTETEKKNYLRTVFATTYLKDVIEHNHLRNAEGMQALIQVLASGIGTPSNPKRIADTFVSNGMPMTSDTIRSYIAHLLDAFIISEALRYDIKGRKYIGSETKYFFEDLGIRNMVLGFRQEEETHLMENAIYNELQLRGYSVDVGMVEIWEQMAGKRVRKNLEVDFVVNQDPMRLYIQSAYALPTREKTMQEQRPLIKIPDHFRKLIIVGDNRGGWFNEEGVEIMGLFDFLLDANSLDTQHYLSEH